MKDRESRRRVPGTRRIHAIGSLVLWAATIGVLPNPASAQFPQPDFAEVHGWKFRLDPQDVGMKQRWFLPDIPLQDWTSMPWKPWNKHEVEVPGQKKEAKEKKEGKEKKEAPKKERPYQDYRGVAWYRATVKMPKEYLRQKLLLDLGRIGEWDRTFVNGVEIGSKKGSGEDRIYSINPRIFLLRPKAPAVVVLRIQGPAKGDSGPLEGSVPQIYPEPPAEKKVTSWTRARSRFQALLPTLTAPYMVADQILLLGQFDSPAAAKFLRKYLGHPDRTIQFATTDVFKGYTDRETRKWFYREPWAGDPSPVLRRNIAQVVAHYKEKEGLEILIKFIEDRDPEVRSAAIRSLAEIPDAATVPYLIEKMQTAPPEERMEISIVLNSLTGEDLGTHPADWMNWWLPRRTGFKIDPDRDTCRGGYILVEARAVTYAPPPPMEFKYRGKLKEATLKKYGGDADTERIVQAGLDWLRRHQDPDGKWSADKFTAHCPADDPCKGTAPAGSTVGVTALALLAFLGTGHTHIQGEHRDVVRLGLRHLLKIQKKDGLMADGGGERMYCHALAALAVIEAYALSRDCKLREAAQLATDYVVSQQIEGSGWRYNKAAGDTDTSVTGWQIMVIRDARAAGLEVPAKSFIDSMRFLDSVTVFRHAGGDHMGEAFYLGRPLGAEKGGGWPRGHKTPALAAVGLFSRLFLDTKPPEDYANAAARICLSKAPGKGEKDFYLWYYATLALFQHGGTQWTQWNDAMKAYLKKTAQLNPKKHTYGSFDPEGAKWGSRGGRVYTTSLAILCLEAYYRYADIAAQ